MGQRHRTYVCDICNWRGTMEAIDFADSVPCPNCGSYLYPVTWWSTWGFALLLIGLSVAFVYVSAYLVTMNP